VKGKKMKTLLFLLTFAVLFYVPNGIVNAASSNKDANTAHASAPATSVTVAIIDFESAAPGNPDFGRQISDILTARLSIFDQYRLVERQKLHDVLKENELNLTGMVETDQAVKAGKLLGAKILIFGRAFPVDKELYIAAKIVGTETSQVKGVIAQGKLEGKLSEIIDQLAEKLTEGLDKWTRELLPKEEKFQNRIEIFKKQLAGMILPTVAIGVPEMHINRAVIDPAAQTEIKKILKDVGFTIIDVKTDTLSKWAKDFVKEPGKPYPADLSDVDVIITGEGFSEFASRIGGLVSCSARLEVQAVKKETRQIICAERTTKRAVDLSEAIAGKTALQAAGNELAFKLIEKITSDLKPSK